MVLRGKRPSTDIGWEIECLKTTAALDDWAPRMARCLALIADLQAFSLDAARRYALRKPEPNAQAEAFFEALEEAVAQRLQVLDAEGAATPAFLKLLRKRLKAQAALWKRHLDVVVPILLPQRPRPHTMPLSRVDAGSDDSSDDNSDDNSDASDSAYSDASDSEYCDSNGPERKRTASAAGVGVRGAKRQVLAEADQAVQQQALARAADRSAPAPSAPAPLAAAGQPAPPPEQAIDDGFMLRCAREWQTWLEAESDPSEAAMDAKLSEMEAELDARKSELAAARAVLQLSEPESEPESEPVGAPSTSERAALEDASSASSSVEEPVVSVFEGDESAPAPEEQAPAIESFAVESVANEEQAPAIDSLASASEANEAALPRDQRDQLIAMLEERAQTRATRANNHAVMLKNEEEMAVQEKHDSELMQQLLLGRRPDRPRREAEERAQEAQRREAKARAQEAQLAARAAEAKRQRQLQRAAAQVSSARPSVELTMRAGDRVVGAVPVHLVPTDKRRPKAGARSQARRGSANGPSSYRRGAGPRPQDGRCPNCQDDDPFYWRYCTTLDGQRRGHCNACAIYMKRHGRLPLAPLRQTKTAQ